ncbi:MAG: glutamate--cysteine ligase [Betaproteobacteria bacterium]|nr:glutamate--cysteine ligase [Betaproteobacteria bacterium]
MTLPRFSTSHALTLGVELELQIVDTKTFDLAPAATDLLRQMEGRKIPGDVKPEMTHSMIELATGVCADHAQTLSQLQEIRGALLESAHQQGVALSGGGTHPFQDWSHRKIYDTPRFNELAKLYGYLAKQFTVFGQHVHVGCPGPDQALVVLHGLSRYVPHLIALSASSPFVRGVDTSFDSARLNSVLAFPLSGRAPFLLSWDEFAVYFGKMTRTGVVQGMKDFYWDIRPKPEFGTVEVRVLDTPLTIEKAAALAAYIQCLARRLWVERPFALHEDDYLPYTFNRFQACRFGLDATFVDPGTGEQRSLRDDLLASFDQLESHAMALHAEGALTLLRDEVLQAGNDATWIRATHASYGEAAPLSSVVRDQVRRWEGSLP